MIYIKFIAGFFLGTIAGSFTNVLIYRLPRGVSLWRRSFCPWCKTAIAWYRLIPLSSYFLSRGRCATCGKVIPVRYLIVELTTGFLFAVATFLSGSAAEILCLYMVIVSLTAIVVIDFYHLLIPDILVCFLFGAGILHYTGHPGRILTGLLGMSLGIVLLTAGGFLGWMLYGVFGFGVGDIKLAAATGFLCGTLKLFYIFSGAVILGATIGLIGLAAGKFNRKKKLPFGVFWGTSMVSIVMFGLIVEKGL